MSTLSEEQAMLHDSAAAWARDRATIAAFRRFRDHQDAPFDDALWREMIELGWTGVAAPERFDGAGMGARALGLILEQAARGLAATPLAATAFTGVLALRDHGDEAQQDRWLPAIVSGQVRVALAVDEEPLHRPEAIALRAVKTNAGYVLDGAKRGVLEGAGADLYILAARTGGEPGSREGLTLFLVPGDAAGLERRRLKTIDHRDVADLSLTGVTVAADAVLGAVDQGWETLDAMLDLARTAVCVEMLGLAVEAFDRTLDYLKTRVQFGQVIGAFQALQHRAAVMLMELELARSAVEAALDGLDARSPDLAERVSVAKVKMGETLFLVSNETIQMHGGIGMTDEHDAGLFLKRARVLENAYGGRAFHRQRFADLRGY